MNQILFLNNQLTTKEEIAKVVKLPKSSGAKDVYNVNLNNIITIA